MKEKPLTTRPLDAAFATRSDRKKKKRNVLLIVGVAAALGSIGSVFAASISINSGNAISFSQGTTTIAACDTDGITAALGAYYSTADSKFNLDTISLTGVSDNCDGKVLTLVLYDGTAKLATVAGTIKTDASTTIAIGIADSALVTDTVNDGTAADVLQSTPTVTYESAQDAGTLAADADRIVIEIN